MGRRGRHFSARPSTTRTPARPHSKFCARLHANQTAAVPVVRTSVAYSNLAFCHASIFSDRDMPLVYTGFALGAFFATGLLLATGAFFATGVVLATDVVFFATGFNRTVFSRCRWRAMHRVLARWVRNQLV